MVEVQANAFSAEFLAPKWLLFYHGRHQAGMLMLYPTPSSSINSPSARHQLRGNMLFTTDPRYHQPAALPILAGRVTKDIKRQVLPDSYEPSNWFPDVWLLTEKDRGARIEGQRTTYSFCSFKKKSGADTLGRGLTSSGRF